MRTVLLPSLLVGTAVGLYAGLDSHDGPASTFLGASAFALILVIGFLVRSARALVEENVADVQQATGRRKKELDREKQSLLKALKELEFDHEMGKISDADFRDIGGQYRARAMRVLRQLDEQGADYRALVEKELKARLGVTRASDDEKPATDEVKAPEKKNVEKKADDKTALPRCESCGTTNDGDAVFCKKCGKKVAS